jgi:arylsulfatase A-like enzyme
VFFISDNGGKESYASQIPLRKGKGWLYEGGIRIPWIMRWPERIPEGKVYQKPVITLDILPTLASLMDYSGKPPITDGIDLSPLFRGEEPETRESLYWHYPHYHKGSGMMPASAIRKGRFKLIEWHERSLNSKEDAYELYDLYQDMGERKNLDEQYPELVEELRQELNDWKKKTEAQMSRINEF